MKKNFKILAITLAILVIIVAIFYVSINESLPKGAEGKEADALANKMLKALNYEAYQDAEVFEWSFRNQHFYKWNKKEQTVEISWDDNLVKLNTKENQDSKVIRSRNESNHEQLIKTATDYFNNDSFWLVAPFKVYDTGVKRSIVKHNNKDALLVTYTSGGSTPGDSYLWILDENGLPTSFKMWVSIIPIGGLEASWNHWITTDNGIQLPTKHKIGIINRFLDLGEVKSNNPKADAIANKILHRINHEAYKSTRFLEWSFGGRRSFKWDKVKHLADVSWNDNRVQLNTKNTLKSTVFVKGIETQTDKEKLIKRAEGIFNNDSFWLVAPHKLFESGIIRSITNVDGKDALKVTYTIGGSTPGDSYIWIVDDSFLPVKYLMNVPSMKMNKVPATWDDWFTTESGTLLPKNHTFSNGRKLSLGDVKAYN